MRRFVDAVNTYRSNNTRACKISVSAGVSPEGIISLNERIVNERAHAVVVWINQHLDEPIDFEVVDMGVDWELLIEHIETRKPWCYMPYKSEVIDLLRTTPEYLEGVALDYNWRYLTLVNLHEGEPCMWLKRYLFPELRYATAELILSCDEAQNEDSKSEVSVVVEPEQNLADDANVAVEEAVLADQSLGGEPLVIEDITISPPLENGEILTNVSRDGSAFCVALKTNTLYLLAAVPNLGIELALGGGWSLAANWQYAWWHSDAVCWYHRIYGGDASLRKWFGRRAAQTPLAGHHVGIYGQMLSYDFVFGKERIGQLADRWSYGAGVEYGYSVPVGKACRFDFTLGVGYLTGEYKRYKLQDECYVWQQTLKRKYIGPTKAEIAFVWTIGGGKGGQR